MLKTALPKSSNNSVIAFSVCAAGKSILELGAMTTYFSPLVTIALAFGPVANSDPA